MLPDTKETPFSVNFHLWQPCNYKCGFCFAGFEDVKKSVLPAGHLTKDEALSVVKQLADFGFGKITFAGGEPILCPWLNDLIWAAKEAGMVTMLVTNGSKLTEEHLGHYKPSLDWLVLSIDSLDAQINLKGGRYQNRHLLPDAKYYLSLVERVHKFGFKLKINTVVHQFNKNDIISDFIEKALPLRWKIFKVLGIKNQNGHSYTNFEISDEDFAKYLKINDGPFIEKIMVAEDNYAMSASYLMVDPAGRFFDNSIGSYVYSSPISEVGVAAAIEQITFDHLQYERRGALYNW